MGGAQRLALLSDWPDAVPPASVGMWTEAPFFSVSGLVSVALRKKKKKTPKNMNKGLYLMSKNTSEEDECMCDRLCE